MPPPTASGERRRIGFPGVRPRRRGPDVAPPQQRSAAPTPPALQRFARAAFAPKASSGTLPGSRRNPDGDSGCACGVCDTHGWAALHPRSDVDAPCLRGSRRHVHLVAALEYVRTGDWADPAFLEDLRSSAKRVRVEDGVTPPMLSITIK
jgi:hypothetical protein